jgi:pimeloyl-ACP methyl ester carboxylesterase
MMIEAVVQTGAFETSYRRAGSGVAVLLLIMEAEAEIGDWLFGQLSRRFRTIAPVLPAGSQPVSGASPNGAGADLEDWLRGLIDGLGLEQPALVAGAACGARLLRFMALDPHRVGRLALVQPADPDGMAPGHLVLGDPGPADPHPVLVMGIPGPEDRDGRSAGLARLARFLADSP